MKLIAIIIELLGIASIGGGIGVEVALHSEVGYIIISSGSVLVAVGGVIWGKFVRSGRLDKGRGK